jgi:hypothetical protein
LPASAASASNCRATAASFTDVAIAATTKGARDADADNSGDSDAAEKTGDKGDEDDEDDDET